MANQYADAPRAISDCTRQANRRARLPVRLYARSKTRAFRVRLTGGEVGEQWSRAQRGPGRRGSRGRVVRLVALMALIAPFTGGLHGRGRDLRFGWPVGVTPQAEAMRHLWTWSGIAALVVGVITWGAMFWAMIFHRKRKDSDPDILPRQTQYNLPVELDLHGRPARSSSRCCSASP